MTIILMTHLEKHKTNDNFMSIVVLFQNRLKMIPSIYAASTINGAGQDIPHWCRWTLIS